MGSQTNLKLLSLEQFAFAIAAELHEMGLEGYAPCGRYPLLWEFELDISRSWIDSFATEFQSVDFEILSYFADDRPTHYTWSSPHLNELADTAEVYRRAVALKALFDGALLVHRRGDYYPRGIGELWDGPTNIRLQGELFPSEPYSSHHDGWEYRDSDSPLRHPVSIWLFLARFDLVVKQMLIFLGIQRVTWITLYAMTDFMNTAGWNDKKIALAASVTEAELTRFSHTANSYPATGPFGRHGAKNHQPPANPMTLKEAEFIVLGATRVFLNERADHQILSDKFSLLVASWTKMLS